MSAEATFLITTAFVSLAFGWGIGLLVKFFKQTSEKI